MKILHRPVTAFCLCLFLIPLWLPRSQAQEESLSPNINKPYKAPDAEKTATRYERDDRDVVEHRDKIIEACELKPGLDVADIGAGTGLFARPFAAKVAPGGTVYAVEITKEFLEHIDKTCKEHAITNVEGVFSTPTSAELPANSVDMAFICDTYHHFEYPFRMLESIHTALRPGGRLIIVDYKKEKGVSPDWIFGHVRANKKTVVEEVAKAEFVFVDEVEMMKLQYVIRFEKKQDGARREIQ
ncbi:MAG: methyltransferase domain-containing protein [Planctomycetes bacterium]|nr:methyltransferase domain-containing protein [Planctomycetota bacterium]